MDRGAAHSDRGMGGSRMDRQGNEEHRERGAARQTGGLGCRQRAGGEMDRQRHGGCVVEHWGVGTGQEGQTNKETDGQDGGAAQCHTGVPEGDRRTDRRGCCAVSHEDGRHRWTDRQAVYVGSHQVGEWQRSRQSDRWTGWTQGSSASAPGERGMDGWMDGGMEGGMDGGMEGVGGWSRAGGLWEHRKRGSSATRPPHLGTPATAPPSTHTQGAQGLCSPRREVGCGGQGGPSFHLWGHREARPHLSLGRAGSAVGPWLTTS